MPSLKSDITISIKTANKSFSIGGVKLPNGKFMMKRGRSRALKMPMATLTQIFDVSRKWAVKNI